MLRVSAALVLHGAGGRGPTLQVPGDLFAGMQAVPMKGALVDEAVDRGHRWTGWNPAFRI